MQASISLAGDAIEITHKSPGAIIEEESETVEIRVYGKTIAFIHDDDPTTDPKKVADIILTPILVRCRAA